MKLQANISSELNQKYLTNERKLYQTNKLKVLFYPYSKLILINENFNLRFDKKSVRAIIINLR
jgi:hypothetical protein